MLIVHQPTVLTSMGLTLCYTPRKSKKCDHIRHLCVEIMLFVISIELAKKHAPRDFCKGALCERCDATLRVILIKVSFQKRFLNGMTIQKTKKNHSIERLVKNTVDITVIVY